MTSTFDVGGDPYTAAVTDSVAGTVTTTVDALGRSVSSTDVWGTTTTTLYDVAGRTSSQTVVNGSMFNSTTAYAYDNVGRLTSESLDGVTVAQPVYSPDTATLDPGILTSISYPIGTGGGNGTAGTFVNDSLGRAVGLTWSGPGGTITSDTLTRSLSAKALTDTIDGALAWTYTYDGAGRLTRATGSGHDYQYGYGASTTCGGVTGANASGGSNSNRMSLTDGATSVGYCYDNADRLIATTQTGYTGSILYDAHGNITTMAGDVSSYDYADRHMSTSHGTATVAYVRDAAGTIVQRTENTTTVTRYTSGGYVLNNAATVLERTISLPGGVLVTKRASGDVWSYPNLHGDIVATSNSAGTKQGGTANYDPYGNTLTTIADNSAGNWDYTWEGQHTKGLEHTTGLAPTIEMGARAYNPSLGRFQAQDPIQGGSANNFDYSNAEPINQNDITGTDPHAAFYRRCIHGGLSDDLTACLATLYGNDGCEPGYYSLNGLKVGGHLGDCSGGHRAGIGKVPKGVRIVCGVLTGSSAVSGLTKRIPFKVTWTLAALSLYCWWLHP